MQVQGTMRLRSMGSNHCLSQAQTAVSGRHFVLREHFKPCTAKLGLQPIAEIDIVERASTQADAIQTRFVSYPFRNLGKRLDQAVVEALAHLRDGGIVPKVLQQGFKHGASVDNPSVALR